MKYLSEITEKHIEVISQAIHDTHPEYDYDKFLQLRLYKIGEKLRENNSMYQLSSEEIDNLCMCLNDCLYVLDDCIRDLADEEVDLRACRNYRMAIEEILSILQRNWVNGYRQGTVNDMRGTGILVAYSATSYSPSNFRQQKSEK